MRKKLDAVDKRGSLIGIKVRQEIKDKIQFISEREGRPMSTQINTILENFVHRYFKENHINWQEYAPQDKKEEGRIENENT